MKKTASIVIATLVATAIGCATSTPPAPMRGADVSAPDRAPAVKSYSEKFRVSVSPP
jgi:hypothetical protein